MRVALLVLVALCRTVQAAPTAEDYFNAGQSAYDQGNYALAIEQWQESYRLSREPALLYNLGQAYRLAGDCAHALLSYRQFLAADPTSEHRTLAEELSREMEVTCGHPAGTPRRVDNAPSSGRNLKIAGLSTGGAGAALVTMGLLFGREASTLGNEVSTACAHGCDWTQQRGKDAAGRRDAAIGYTFDGIGAVAIAAGAVMYYLGARAGGVAVVPRLHEGGAVISWSTSW